MPYNVCRLTALIREECAIENIYLPLNGAVEYHPATTLRAIDSTNQRVTVEIRESTQSMAYDRLVLALGTHATMPQFKQQPNAIPAISFHTLSDALALLTKISPPSRIAIIGGGINGLELAAALLSRGMQIVLAEQAAHCLPHLPPDVGLQIAALLEKLGCTIICESTLDALTPQGIEINGSEYPVACAVITTGVAPATKSIGFEGRCTSQGEIITNSASTTSIPNIFAIGDCAAEERAETIIRPSYRWGSAVAQGILLGRRLRTGKQHTFKLSEISIADIGPLRLSWSGTYAPNIPVEKIQSDKTMKWCWYTKSGSMAGFVQMSMLDHMRSLYDITTYPTHHKSHLE
jgi:3-phenylpropionate/trans-cinnamate dioxygenase ferredoxin reductase subunit